MLGEIVEVFGTYFTAAQYTLRDESLRMVRSEVRDIYRAIMSDIVLDVIRELPVVIEERHQHCQRAPRLSLQR